MEKKCQTTVQFGLEQNKMVDVLNLKPPTNPPTNKSEHIYVILSS